MEKVLFPGEVYVKSSPVEWERFNQLITSEAPFTHVVDAANVASAGFLHNPHEHPLKASHYVSH